MITDDEAIQSAVQYLHDLPAELLGFPKDIQLEAIQHFDNEWAIVLSYLSQRDLGLTPTDSPLAKALSTFRRSRELVVDDKSGKVKVMTSPHADA